MSSSEQRPPIGSVADGAELRRWYWLKSELIELARARGVSTAGGKIELTERLVAHLDGQPPPRTRRRPAAGRQLEGELTRETVIPPGQRSSQPLLAFFAGEIGPGFRFDAPMRDFVAAGGRTLGEAVDHWHATRDRPREEIAPQFELNRFVRAWHEEHPEGGREQALAAWREYRARPRPPR